MRLLPSRLDEKSWTRITRPFDAATLALGAPAFPRFEACAPGCAAWARGSAAIDGAANGASEGVSVIVGVGVNVSVSVGVRDGGTLRQHVGVDEGDGHPRFDEDGRKTAHGVDVVDGSLAASLYGSHLEVKSCSFLNEKLADDESLEHAVVVSRARTSSVHHLNGGTKVALCCLDKHLSTKSQIQLVALVDRHAQHAQQQHK